MVKMDFRPCAERGFSMNSSTPLARQAARFSSVAWPVSGFEQLQRLVRRVRAINLPLAFAVGDEQFADGFKENRLVVHQ
jgi:hypothetical protein